MGTLARANKYLICYNQIAFLYTNLPYHSAGPQLDILVKFLGIVVNFLTVHNIFKNEEKDDFMNVSC